MLTDRLPVYSWPAGTTARLDRPVGLLLVVSLAAVAYARARRGRRALEGGPLLGAFAIFLLCVAWGAVRGWLAGGDVRIIVLEVRPFVYLFLAYLLAHNAVDTARAVRTIVWLIVAGAGVKALQGLYVYAGVLHGRLEGRRSILAHEESFFLAVAVVLLLVFWLHHRDRLQHAVLLQLLPLVAVVIVANQRRIAYLELLAGAAVAWALAFLVAAADRRRRLVRILAVGVPLVAFYVLAFHADTSFVARPARGLVSMFHPDPLDAKPLSSNLYRSTENDALLATVGAHPIAGIGFGRPFLQPVALPDIGRWAPYYLHVPHNTIYWVWMRLGTIGFLALWYLLGSLIVRGALTARRLRTPYLQDVAILVVAATVMEILAAYADYQLFALRNVLYLGVLAGVLTRLPGCEADRP